MLYSKVLERLIEEFMSGKPELFIRGGRGYSPGSPYVEKTNHAYGESEIKRKAREEEIEDKKRKSSLNKEEDKEEVDISKAFEERIDIHELKKIIRRILHEE